MQTEPISVWNKFHIDSFFVFVLNWHGYKENENAAILITDFTHQRDKKIYLNGFDQNKIDINHAQNEYLHTRNKFRLYFTANKYYV